MMQPFSTLDIILILLALALVISTLFRRLHLPVILGYLFAGILVGPQVLGWMHNAAYLQNLAEFGIVFLMFTVGLEFSLPKLIALKRTVILLGGLQVILCIFFTTLIGGWLGMTWLSAFVTGGIVAMSSTAIVVKQLADQLEINDKHGLNAISILLFQDISVIIFMILLASFVQSHQPIAFILSLALAKGLFAIATILIIGRLVLKPLLRMIATTQVTELFTLAVLLVILTAAWITHFFQLSYALGAFLAGMMLAETEFRHQIAVEIRPFRDVLLGLFFITIGMLLNINLWPATWIWISLLVFAMIIGKSILITILSYLFDKNKPIALQTGLVLAQGSEFGFAILTLATTHQMIPAEYAQVILSALIITIGLGPLLIQYNQRIAQTFFPKSFKFSYNQVTHLIAAKARSLKNHVIICGYGHVGQNLAQILEQTKIPYLILDLDPEHIQVGNMAGVPISYGDATHPEILKAAALNQAKALVIAFTNTSSTIKILNFIKQSHKKIFTLVRCKNDIELAKLQNYSANKIVTETHEESLMLAYHLLLAFKMSQKNVQHLIQDVRKEDSDLLKQAFPGALDELFELNSNMKQLRPIFIPDHAYAMDKTIGELNLDELDVSITTIRRSNTHHIRPRRNMKLRANDILVLFGTPEQLEAAERILLMD